MYDISFVEPIQNKYNTYNIKNSSNEVGAVCDI